MYRKINISQKPNSSEKIGEIKVKREPIYRVNRKSFNIKADPANVEIEWYSEKSKTSQYIEGEFTNYVDELLTDVKVENAVNVLNNNLESLKNHHLQKEVNIPNNAEGKRLTDILNMYFDFNDTKPEDYWFVRAFIQTELQEIQNHSGPVRIVMVNMKDLDSGKHLLQVVFVDLYHLFVLGGHKKDGASKTKEKSYQKHSKLDVCLSKHIK